MIASVNDIISRKQWRMSQPAEGVSIDSQRQPTLVQRIGGMLQHLPPAHRAAVLILQGQGLMRRSRQVADYMRDVPSDQRGLFVGSGAITLDGWLCSDLVPVRPSIMYLDATKHWPIPSASFRYIVSEHMLEQVPYDDGLQVLAEAHRILVSGGVLRISITDLDVVRRLPDSDDPEVREYIQWNNRAYGSAAERVDATNPAHAVNRLMRFFGHTYLWDQTTLRTALAGVGFHGITRCDPGRSQHAKLVGADRHAVLIGEAANRLESLIFEATA
jgi:predicted SAM-dependent methyltransferase